MIFYPGKMKTADQLKNSAQVRENSLQFLKCCKKFEIMKILLEIMNRMLRISHKLLYLLTFCS